MAYAELAGLSPVAGPYALLLPASIYTFLGSSRHLMFGPEGSISALVAAAIIPLAVEEPERYASLAALLALLVGGVYLLARIIRLGWVADYFSRAVLLGYIHGARRCTDCRPTRQTFRTRHRGARPGCTGHRIRPGVFRIERRNDRGRGRLPIPAVAPPPTGSQDSGVIARRRVGDRSFSRGRSRGAWARDRGRHTVGIIRLRDTGPESRRHPDAAACRARNFFVSFADQILTARSFAGKHGRHVRADQELFAMGLANIAAGISQSFSMGASGSRTAVNDQTGGRTQLSGLVGAAAVALVLLFLTEPMSYLPIAALGAVIVAAAVGLFDLRAWREIAHTSRVETFIAAATMLGVILVGVLQAFIVAVVLSVFDVVRRSARPHDAVLGWVERLGRYADVSLHPRAKIDPGVLVYRLDDRLFFANASYVGGRIREAIEGAPSPVRWFVFDAEELTHIDATGVGQLKSLVVSLGEDGIAFAMARLKGPLQQTLDEVGVLDLIGKNRVFPTVRSAVETARGSREEVLSPWARLW